MKGARVRARSFSGVTLIELLISMGMFVLLLGTVFLLFGIGSRGFRTVEARQGAQNQLAAVRSSLQNDLQVSHFYGIHLDTTNTIPIAGVEQPRDAISAVTLSDWDHRDQFGVPDWDQWVLYRVTYEEQGQLLRHVVLPEPGQHGRALLRPAGGLADVARTVAPYNPAWDRVSPPQVLARGVRSFAARLDQQQRAVEIAVTIEQKTAPENPKPDVVTATFYIKPHNTVPTD